MRQELIDLLLGELEPAEAEALKARVRADPLLGRELLELESLFGLMRRGEEVEPLAATRATVLAAAAAARPPLRVRLRALPGLVAYRFRTSPRFRIAMISLCAHVVVIAVLAQILLRPTEADPRGPFEFHAEDAPATPVEPDQGFVLRLSQRRVSQSARLRQYGVAFQGEAIDAGLAQLLAAQRPDGSFGDAEETGYAALAFLAQGDGSAQPTPKGLAVRRAVHRLLAEIHGGGKAHGAMLAALVEDYGLSYAALDPIARMDYVVAIRKLIAAVPDDDMSGEALLLAHLAGFPVPGGRLGDAELALASDRTSLLGLEPTRLRVAAAMARGRSNLAPEEVARWAGPLFERAIADVMAGRAGGLVVVTLQSPYRL
jgi:hypothetical protein